MTLGSKQPSLSGWVIACGSNSVCLHFRHRPGVGAGDSFRVRTAGLPAEAGQSNAMMDWQPGCTPAGPHVARWQVYSSRLKINIYFSRALILGHVNQNKGKKPFKIIFVTGYKYGCAISAQSTWSYTIKIVLNLRLLLWSIAKRIARLSSKVSC